MHLESHIINYITSLKCFVAIREKTGWKFIVTVFKFDTIFLANYISHVTSHWGNFLVNNDSNVADEINEG